MAARVQIKPSYEWSEEGRRLGVSRRELEVFALVAEGFSNKEIADILNIKHQSVKNHMHSFSRKLRVKNSTQALVVAIHLHLITLEERVRYDDLSLDMKITDDDFMDRFRRLIDGEIRSPDFKEKDRRALRVFLLKHGIDVYAEKEPRLESEGDPPGEK